jgi:hypothetical protein
MPRAEEMPPKLEQILDQPVHHQVPLRLPAGFEPPHMPFSGARRLVRCLGSGCTARSMRRRERGVNDASEQNCSVNFPGLSCLSSDLPQHA